MKTERQAKASGGRTEGKSAVATRSERRTGQEESEDDGRGCRRRRRRRKKHEELDLPVNFSQE